MDEHFRPIDGFPGYRVSRDGEVQSRWLRAGRHSRLTDAWLPLKPIRRVWGHLKVNLSRGGRKYQRLVHRLVLAAFVGPCPEGLVCCHGDGDPANNRVENLRWDTPQANADDTLRHGRRAVGSRCNSKLTEEDVLAIRRLRAEGLPLGDLAGRFGVRKQNIQAIVYGRSWRHLPMVPGRSDESMETLQSLGAGGCEAA
jgi:hypothetical protein